MGAIAIVSRQHPDRFDKLASHRQSSLVTNAWRRPLQWLAAICLTTTMHAQVLAPSPHGPPPAPASPVPSPPSRYSGGTGSATGDAAAALVSGDLVRADILYRAAYQMGDRSAATLAARAQLALWQNKLIEAETLAKAIDTATPEAAIAGEVLQTVARRRNEDLAEVYRRATGATARLKLLKRDPLPYVVAMIDGRAGGFIVDTGSAQLLLADNFAQLLGIEASRPSPSPPAAEKSAAQPPEALLDTFDIGDLRLSLVPATITPARRLPVFSPAPDGVIGLRFLARFRATIDYP